ncbi:MAG: hypothetical protein ACPG19_14085 [Saprospiraceae bacterium]
MFRTTEMDDKLSQMILLNRKGEIVESCNTLLDTTQLPTSSVVELSPLVESIFDYLLDLTSDEPEVAFSKVESPLPQLDGFYDFTFTSISLNGYKYILWQIYDHTSLYTELQKNQQRMHDLELQRHQLYNKFQYIVEKNLALKQKEIPLHQKSLLLEANNIILKQVFLSLEKLTEATKPKSPNAWVESFSLKKVLNKLELGLDKNKNSLLQITVSMDEDFQLIGSESRLLYILYDLLSLSNQENSDEIIKLDLKVEKLEKLPYIQLIIQAFNPSFIKEDIKDFFVKNEISPLEGDSISLQIGLIQKLIKLQSGQFKILENTSKGTLFEVHLRFPTVYK